MAVTNVINYDGESNYIVVKHPCEDFNNLTQLIVHQSQEALFVYNGEILDSFSAGKYTLDTEKAPVIGGLIARLTKGGSQFHAEVYFVNKATRMALKWGTSEKIRFIDPSTGIPLDIGAYGSMNLEVLDARKLVTKLVGTSNGINWDVETAGLTQSIVNSFRPMYNMVLKTYLSKAIKQQQINIIEIDEHLEELSNIIHQKIDEEFNEFGLTIPKFYIDQVTLPEDDDNFKRIKRVMASSFDIKEEQAKRATQLEQEITATERKKMELEREVLEAQVAAQKAKLEGFAKAEVMNAQGYNHKDEINAEVQKAYAQAMGNFGPDTVTGSLGSSMASEMMQMSMGMTMANAMSGQMNQMVNNTVNGMNNNQLAKTNCPNCGGPIDTNAKFCPNCGQAINRTCPKCGNQLEGNVKFCPNCGEKVG